MVKPRQKYERKLDNNNGGAKKQGLLVTSLPIDIILNILSRISVESILICRSVCKSWYVITQDPSFIKLYQERHKNDEQLCQYILQTRYGSTFLNFLLLDIYKEKLREIFFSKMKLPPPSIGQDLYNLPSMNLISSCNGLLCLIPKAKVDPVIICNPITRDCWILPSSKTGLNGFPYKSCQVGFHSDPLSENKYKVVREFRFFNDQPSKFQLITVGDSSWKELSGAPNYVLEQGYDPPIYWNGAFHWKISEVDHRYDNNCIASFDLIDETFRFISFTQTYEEPNPRNYQLVSLGDELKIAEHDSRFLKIWKVSGNKIEGFSISLEHRFVLCVPRRRLLQHDLVCEIERRSYLMQVFRWENGLQKCSLVRFCPEIGQNFELETNCLPSLFRIVCFKPTLVSPIMPID